MGVTIGQSYDETYKVDGPDPDAEDSHTVEGVELTDAEAEAREKAAKASKAQAEAVAAERAAQADHVATMETSDPDNPQDANGNVVHEPPPASGVDGQAAVQDAGAEDEQDEDKPYDPTEHNAPEVREYLGKADAKERKRVIAAEKKADKPRKSIIEFTV